MQVPVILALFAQLLHVAYAGTCQTYTIQADEGCWHVCDRFKVTESQLERWNSEARIRDWFGCNNLIAGATICVSEGVPPDYVPVKKKLKIIPAKKGRCQAYDVRPNDSCHSIALSLGVPLEQLIAWNNNARPYRWKGCDNLQVKQRICVSAGNAPKPKPNRKLQCGPESLGQKSCPLNACCSGWGYCGLSSEFCDTFHGEPCYSNCGTVQLPQCHHTEVKRRVGYFASWASRRSDFPVSTSVINPAFTHIIFSFAVINPETLRVEFDHPGDAALAQEVIQATHAFGGKVMIAIGGWAFSQDLPTRHIFSDMLYTRANRAHFIASIIKMCQYFGFDGVDLDFEYPGAIERRGDRWDTKHLSLLIEELRMEFDVQDMSHLEISIATPASFWFLQVSDSRRTYFLTHFYK